MPDKPQPAAVGSPVGNPVEYKVVDYGWLPNDPQVAEDQLNVTGQDGWRLINVYPDPLRERTRWIFSR